MPWIEKIPTNRNGVNLKNQGLPPFTWFIEYPHGPLVRWIPVGEGRRVESFAHLLSPAAADSPSVTAAPPAASDTAVESDWRADIEARLASLEYEIAVLKARQMP